MAALTAPDWETRATLPRRACSLPKLALSPLAGRITPRQLGPSMRMRLRRAASTRRSCSGRALVTALGEAPRVDHRDLDAIIPALIEDRRYLDRRHGDQGQVDLLVDVPQALVAGPAGHLRVLGVDGVALAP